MFSDAISVPPPYLAMLGRVRYSAMASHKFRMRALTLHISETTVVAFVLVFRPPGPVGKVGKVSGAAHESEQKG